MHYLHFVVAVIYAFHFKKKIFFCCYSVDFVIGRDMPYLFTCLRVTVNVTYMFTMP